MEWQVNDMVLIVASYHFGKEEKEIIIYDKDIPLIDKNSRSLMVTLVKLCLLVQIV